jgi:beta-galactosidase/beta-glucuronidase
VVPEIESSTAAFHFECKNTDEDDRIRMEIIAPDGQSSTTVIDVKNGFGEQKVSIKPLFLWNPNEPHLYRLKIHLIKGEQCVDYVQSYFGMRKIASSPTGDPNAPEVLSLNNIPRYHRGVLHQAYYPEGVYTPGDVERMKNDIAFAKKVGFNFLRIHIKLEDPLLLYYADTMGMLLMCDFPNFGEGGDTSLGRKRFEEMMRRAIRRDFNHPSIFSWCLFNETWGFGGQVEFVKLFSKDPRDKGGLPASAAGISATVSEVPVQNAKDAAEAARTRVKFSNQSSTRRDAPDRGHECCPLGTSGLLRARRYGHQFMAFLHG